MARVVPVDVGGGVIMYVEATDDADVEVEGRGRVSVGARRAPGEPVDFSGAMASIRTATGQLFETLKDMDVSPDAFELTFGVKISSKVGALIAEASGEANFTIKMSWAGLKAKPKTEVIAADAKPGP